MLRKKLAVEARAHVADDVDDAMPASGHTGGHARAKPLWAMCRRRGKRVARVRDGLRRRQGAPPALVRFKPGLESSARVDIQESLNDEWILAPPQERNEP